MIHSTDSDLAATAPLSFGPGDAVSTRSVLLQPTKHEVALETPITQGFCCLLCSEALNGLGEYRADRRTGLLIWVCVTHVKDYDAHARQCSASDSNPVERQELSLSRPNGGEKTCW
jgi:hypothetical protein